MKNEILINAAAYMVMICAYKLIEKKKEKKRRWWVAPHNERNTNNGPHLLLDLLKEPTGKFEYFCKMSFEDFEYLLQKIEPVISKKDTKWRKAIPAKDRLALTLRFLASGDSFKNLHYLFKMSPQVISNIVPEVCNAIVKELNDLITIPKSENDWKSIAENFENIWDFPHCVGSLGGKHIVLQSPIIAGSDFYNYTQYSSIVLMALVDADYCFTFVECSSQGRISDGAVIQNMEFFRKIENNQFHSLPKKPLPGQNKPVPYVFVADNTFELSEQIIKPYPDLYDEDSEQKFFNHHSFRISRIVENVFGIMASVFRILRKPILVKPDKVTVIVMTCAILHNFLRKSETSRSTYSPLGTFDFEEYGNIIPGSWRQDNDDLLSLLPLNMIPKNFSQEAIKIRDEFAEYFLNSGRAK